MTDTATVTTSRVEVCGRFGGCPLPAGHNRGMADIPENHRRPDPTPTPDPGVVRRPWSEACARRHDHPACGGALPAAEDPWGAETGPLPCGCPCHAATPTAENLAAVVDAITGATLDRAQRVYAARQVIRLADHLDPAGLAAYIGDGGPDAREVRRLGRALQPAARLHRDHVEHGTTGEDDRG